MNRYREVEKLLSNLVPCFNSFSLMIDVCSISILFTSFLKLHNHINPRAITEFSYRYRSNEKAFIYLSFLLGTSPSSKSELNSTAATSTSTTSTSTSNPNVSSAANQSASIPTTTSNGTQTPPLPTSAVRSTELQTLLDDLEKDGMPAMDISDNEFAKSHARYLVGGRSEVKDERVFRFGEFIVVLLI